MVTAEDQIHVLDEYGRNGSHRQNKTTKMLKSGAKRLRNTETNILKKKKKPKQTRHSRRVDGEIIIKEITEKSIS